MAETDPLIKIYVEYDLTFPGIHRIELTATEVTYAEINDLRRWIADRGWGRTLDKTRIMTVDEITEAVDD